MSATDRFAYRSVRWPLVATAFLLAVGTAMFLGAAWLYTNAESIRENVATPSKLAAVATDTPESVDSKLVPPPSEMYLDDLRTLFKFAAEKHVVIATADYQSEGNRPAGVMLKHVVFHVDQDYSKVKGFVAELLGALPHAQLEEIQIEQGSDPQASARIQATIKIVLVYRKVELVAPTNTSVAGS